MSSSQFGATSSAVSTHDSSALNLQFVLFNPGLVRAPCIEGNQLSSPSTAVKPVHRSYSRRGSSQLSASVSSSSTTPAKCLFSENSISTGKWQWQKMGKGIVIEELSIDRVVIARQSHPAL